MDPHKTRCLSNSTLVKHSVLEAPMSKTHSEITTFTFQDDPMPNLPLSFPFLFPFSLFFFHFFLAVWGLALGLFVGGAPFNFGDPYRNPCFGVSKTHSKVGGRENLPPQNTVFEKLDPRKTQCFRSSNVKNT